MKYKIGQTVMYEGRRWEITSRLPGTEKGNVYFLVRGDFQTMAYEEELSE